MVKFGIIGTSSITERFIDAGKKLKNIEITALYSRTEKRALEFAAKHDIPNIYTDVKEMASSSVVDAVYIASPNSFHFQQAIDAMKAGKHVLCEKPMAVNSLEVAKMIKTAKEEGVLLMEAMKTTFCPNFKIIQDNLYKIGKLRKFYGNFCRYSSAYEKILAGKLPNVFNPQFAGGALMDIGIYLLYPTLKLFGTPKEIKCSSTLLPSGVDGEGNLFLEYEDFTAFLSYSKITQSYIPSEIQGELGSMIIEKLSNTKSIKLLLKDGTSENLTIHQDENLLSYEIKEFVSLILKGVKESSINSHNMALLSSSVMEKARKQVGVRYPSDFNTTVSTSNQEKV